MSKGSILLTVPANIEKLATILEDAGGVSYDLPGDNELPLGERLANATPGQSVRIDFEDDEEPLYAVLDAAKALEAEGAGYWGIFDAFVEKSRGLRVQERVALNMSGRITDRHEKEIPWTHGEPSFDERTLLAAGFDWREINEAVAKFFTDAAPAPGSTPPPGASRGRHGRPGRGGPRRHRIRSGDRPVRPARPSRR